MEPRRNTRRSVAAVRLATPSPTLVINSSDDDDKDDGNVPLPPQRITTRARSRQPSPSVAAATVEQNQLPFRSERLRRRSVYQSKESIAVAVDTVDGTAVAKRGRGRPPRRPAVVTSTTTATIRESSNEEDVEDVSPPPPPRRSMTPIIVDRLLQAIRRTPTPTECVAEMALWSPSVRMTRAIVTPPPQPPTSLDGINVIVLPAVDTLSSSSRSGSGSLRTDEPPAIAVNVPPSSRSMPLISVASPVATISASSSFDLSTSRSASNRDSFVVDSIDEDDFDDANNSCDMLLPMCTLPAPMLSTIFEGSTPDSAPNRRLGSQRSDESTHFRSVSAAASAAEAAADAAADEVAAAAADPPTPTFVNGTSTLFTVHSRHRPGHPPPHQRTYIPGRSEFGGTWGAVFWLLAVPIAGVYLQSSCTLTHCRSGIRSLLLPAALPVPMITGEALGLFAAFTALHYLFAALDVGRTYSQLRRGSSRAEFVFQTGTPFGVFLMALAFGECAGWAPLLRIYRAHVSLCIISLVYGLAVAVYCYRGRDFAPIAQSNEFGRSGRLWADFFNGPDIHVRVMRLVDMKVLHHRMAVHGALLLNAVVLLANAAIWLVGWQTGGTVKIGMLVGELERMEPMPWRPEADVVSTVCAALACIALLVRLGNERLLLTSFELSEEGVGAQLMLRYALYPFAAALPARMAFERKVDMPEWALAGMAAVFAFGLVVRHVADAVKYKYRTHPTRPVFDVCPVVVSTARYYSYHDFLLCGGWGLVRHPNYAGEMLCTLALCAPFVWRFTPQPLLLALFHCAYMVHRSWRVQRRIGVCYGEDYRTYRELVPKRLVPGIF